MLGLSTSLRLGGSSPFLILTSFLLLFQTSFLRVYAKEGTTGGRSLGSSKTGTFTEAGAPSSRLLEEVSCESNDNCTDYCYDNNLETSKGVDCIDYLICNDVNFCQEKGSSTSFNSYSYSMERSFSYDSSMGSFFLEDDFSYNDEVSCSNNETCIDLCLQDFQSTLDVFNLNCESSVYCRNGSCDMLAGVDLQFTDIECTSSSSCVDFCIDNFEDDNGDLLPAGKCAKFVTCTDKDRCSITVLFHQENS